MKKILVILLSLIMLTSAALLVACESEIVYRYEHAGQVEINANPSSSGGNNYVQQEDDGSSYALTIWCAEEDEAMIWDMLAEYENIHEKNHYDFTVQTVGEDKVSSAVTTDVAAAADVFSFANDQLGLLLNQRALYQIPSIYNDLIESQIDVAVESCANNGNYYAIPYSYENCFLYYNTDKLNANDVKSMETLLSKSIAGVDANLGIDMADSYYTTMFLYTAGMEIFGKYGTDANNVNLNNANTIAGCRYIQDLGKNSKLKSIMKEDQANALANGNVAALISGPHMISAFRTALGSKFGVAMLPTVRMYDAGKDTVQEKQLVSFSGVKMYGISNKATTVRNAKHTAEACRVAAFLANKENQRVRFETREFCPTDAELFREVTGEAIDTVKVVIQQSEYTKLKPGLSQMSVYWTPMANFLVGVFKQTKSPNDSGASGDYSNWEKELASIEAKMKE